MENLSRGAGIVYVASVLLLLCAMIPSISLYMYVASSVRPGGKQVLNELRSQTVSSMIAFIDVSTSSAVAAITGEEPKAFMSSDGRIVATCILPHSV